MGQEISCPCNNNDSNVYFPPEEEERTSMPTMKAPDTPDTSISTNLNTGASSSSTIPFDTHAVSKKSKSRKWAAASRDGPSGLDTSSTQRAGEDAIGDGEGHISREEMESALGNVRGELAFPEDSPSGQEGVDGLFTIEHDSRSLRTHEQVPSVATYVDSVVVTECDFRSAAHASAESEAMRAARAKQEAHNDRIVATFNSVMLADGLKVLKHHRRSSRKAASRVIRFVPDYGGALVWDKPLRQPGAKASRVPLDAINQVELEQRIVWISAGDERVGFETSKAEDADLMYQAICILVDRCHAA